jgi:hypothetical protein
MENMELKKEVREEVREYFQKVQDTQDKQNELNGFLEDIAPSLKSAIQSEIFSKSLDKNLIL